MTLPYTLTLVAQREAGLLTSAMVEQARELVSGQPALVLSEGEAVDIPCPAPVPGQPSLDAIRTSFMGQAVDVLLTRSRGRRKGLLVADMDSTIVSSETLDELAIRAGVGEEVAAITRQSMNGEIDFASALRERVKLLKKLSVTALEQTWAETKLTPGARTLVATMRAHNATTALVSGGFTWFSERVAAACGFDIHHANQLGIQNGRLTGSVAEPILGREAKLESLRSLAGSRGLRLAATLAVGDGANDLDMLREAGVGVAFHAKPVVTDAIANRVDHADLRALLFAQGYRAADFSE
ncbi:MAG: phosphoserine phosphatase SerB [Janthinobacterium lividum]